MKAAMVVAGVGGALAAVEGVLLIALGSLAGLAENPAGEATRTGGWVVLALGALILTAVFAARRSRFALAVTTAVAAVAGFFVENRCGCSRLPVFSPPRRSPSSRSEAN